jgi:uncharacterized protein YidB (DUF937 family)
MALLDQVLGSLMGGGGSSSSSLQGVLMTILGGGQQGGMGGGLGGLLATLQQAGLGDIAQSWADMAPINQSRPSNCTAPLVMIRCRAWLHNPA